MTPSEPDTVIEPDPADAPASKPETTSAVSADAQAHDPALPDPEPAPAAEVLDTAPATTATIEIADHKIDVKVEDVPTTAKDDTVAAIADGDLDRLRKILAEDAARRGRVEERPFEHVDTESLLVLSGKIRAEMASR